MPPFASHTLEDCLTLFLNGIRACAGIVDHDSLDVIVGGIVGIQHCIGYIWDIVSCVAFTRDEDLSTLQSEGVHEVLEKSKELRCNFFFIGCRCIALREASANWLLDLLEQL